MYVTLGLHIAIGIIYINYIYHPYRFALPIY